MPQTYPFLGLFTLDSVGDAGLWSSLAIDSSTKCISAITTILIMT